MNWENKTRREMGEIVDAATRCTCPCGDCEKKNMVPVVNPPLAVCPDCMKNHWDLNEWPPIAQYVGERPGVKS